MSLYKISIKPISPITGIPDSQTIFGLLCHMFVSYYGENELETLLNDIKKDAQTLLISSMFYENTLPIPKNFTPLHEEISNKKQASESKAIKKIKYFSLGLYREYIKSKEKFENTFLEQLDKKNYIIINDEIVSKKDELLNEKYLIAELKIRNKVSLKKEDKKLFYEKIFYVNEKLNFNFYLDVDLKYEEKIKKLITSMNYVSIGGSKSIGFNLYNFINIEKSDIKRNKPHLLISKSIGDSSINFENSFYDLKVTNNKFNNAKDTIFRKQIVTLVEGSYIDTCKDVIGSLVEEHNDKNITYQYMIGFLI